MNLTYLDEIELTYETLEHYGVPGMKWGVRKDPYMSIGNSRFVSRKRNITGNATSTFKPRPSSSGYSGSLGTGGARREQTSLRKPSTSTAAPPTQEKKYSFSEYGKDKLARAQEKVKAQAKKTTTSLLDNAKGKKSSGKKGKSEAQKAKEKAEKEAAKKKKEEERAAAKKKREAEAAAKKAAREAEKANKESKKSSSSGNKSANGSSAGTNAKTAAKQQTDPKLNEKTKRLLQQMKEMQNHIDYLEKHRQDTSELDRIREEDPKKKYRVKSRFGHSDLDDGSVMIFPEELIKPDFEETLKHFGILGQKWGKRNGPPYPLDQEDHSKSEKDAGYKKSKAGKHNEDQYDKKSKSKSGDVNQKSKEKKAAKFSEEKIESHRQKMIKELSFDPELQKAYKDATNEQIAKDLQHRENVKKALIAGAAVVGLGAAAYIIYRYRLNAGLQAVKSASHATVDDLLSKGLNIDTANKVMTLTAKGDVVKDAAVKKAIINGLNSEMDLIIKDPAFAKVTFGGGLKNAHHLEWLSYTKDDLTRYSTMLRDWEEEARTGIAGARRNPITTMLEMANGSELRIPSTAKQSEILDELLSSDPTISHEVEKSLKSILSKAYKISGYDDVASKLLADAGAGREMSANKVAATVHSLIDHNPELDKKISQAFKEKGYGAILDTFDMGDFTELPIIAFGDLLKIR